MITTYKTYNGEEYSLLGCVTNGKDKSLQQFDIEWHEKASKMAKEKNCNVFWNIKKIDSNSYGDCQYFLLPISEEDAEILPYIFNGYWIGVAYAPNRKLLSHEQIDALRKPYMDCVSGYDYEEQCAEELRSMGYKNVEVTKSSGDQGIDVIAWKDGLKYGIQCKHYQGSVPNKAVQEAFSGAKFYDCDVAVVMTNSTFTDSAKELADKIGVKLWSSNVKYREV